MYKKNFIVALKLNGKILREIDESVVLPFDSEYSLMFKNLNSRKVQVSVSIDGKDILDGKKLVIDGNKEVELEGYMCGFSAKNRFKFIKKTKEITNHRGDFLDDSLIRVEYQFEKKIVTERVETEYMCAHHYNDPIVIYNNTPKPEFFNQEINICDAGNFNTGDGTGSIEFSNNSNMGMANKLRSRGGHSPRFKKCMDMGFIDNPTPEPNEDEGITVKGSHINQQFREVFMGELEESSSVIILKLRGHTGKQKMVYKPITVKTKLQCETCGRNSRSNAKFCMHCGTSLI